MDVAQIDHDLEELHGLARKLMQRLDQLSDIQKHSLAAVLVDLAPLFQNLPSRAEANRLLLENQRSKALLEAIFEASPSGMGVVAGEDLEFVFVNPVYRFLSPSNETNLIGLRYAQVWAEDPEGGFVDQVRQALRTGKPFQTLDFSRRFSDGCIRTFIFQVRRINWADQPAALVVLWDITERKQVEEALKESEQKINELIRFAPAAIYEIDFRNRCFTSVNDMMCQLSGYTREELLAMNPFDILDDTGKALFQERIKKWLAGEKPDESVEYQVRAKDGHTIYSLLNVTFNADASGQPLGATVIGMDITERKRAEQALAEFTRQAEENRQIRDAVEVQRHLLEQREQERMQIARDLHDGPMQDLVGAVYEMQSLVMNTEEPEMVRKIKDLQGMLQATIVELRAYAQALRPPALSKYGLEKAIRSNLAGFKSRYPNFQITFTSSLDEQWLTETVRLALYRIFQEAMTNLSRHSGASAVNIRLEQADGQGYLEIQDNGQGFDLPKDWLELARQGHLGLVGMRERAEAAGGKMEIHTRPGEGMRLLVVIPIRNPAEISPKAQTAEPFDR